MSEPMTTADYERAIAEQGGWAARQLAGIIAALVRSGHLDEFYQEAALVDLSKAAGRCHEDARGWFGDIEHRLRGKNMG